MSYNTQIWFSIIHLHSFLAIYCTEFHSLSKEQRRILPLNPSIMIYDGCEIKSYFRIFKHSREKPHSFSITETKEIENNQMSFSSLDKR